MEQLSRVVNFPSLLGPDTVVHDNLVFRLHHKINFLVIFVGLIFISSQNFLNEKAIVCSDQSVYTNHYCWLHASINIPDQLLSQTKCIGDQGGKNDETKHYLWLPFILGLCLLIVKIPRYFWTHFCEKGLMESILQQRSDTEKLSSKFRKLKRRSFVYFISFGFCEILNISSLVACFLLLDQLLGGKYLYYGTNVHNYLMRKSDLSNNPMCILFPTEVSCNPASLSKETEESILCVLSNNQFNQYYFFIMWIWWIGLLIISLIGLLFRLVFNSSVIM